MSKSLTTNQKNNAVTTQDRLKGLFAQDSVRSRFNEMLGKKSAGFISSVLSSVASNNNLAKCDPASVVASAAIAASMDLPVNPSLGMAHIVPYNGVAQFQMGWKGYVQLAMRSGQYKTLNAAIVREGQIKSHNPFTGEIELNIGVIKPDAPVVGYMLYFKLVNGYEKYFYMTLDECMAHGKKYSQSFKKGFGQWAENFDAMALKTVVKLGLSKYGILSLDMQNAISSDERDVTPANDIVNQMHEIADMEAVNNKMDAVAVDTVQSPELESQEPDPGEFVVSFGSRKNKPCKLREIPEKELTEFISWAYTQEKLTDHIKDYLLAAEK